MSQFAIMRNRGLALALLVGALPCLMAILPWDFETGMTPFRALLLINSVAVLLVEIGIIFWAIALDCSPLQALLNLPRTALAAMGTLVLIALWTGTIIASRPADAMLGLLTWIIHLLFGLSVWTMARRRMLLFDARCWGRIAAGVLAYGILLAIFLIELPDRDHRDWAPIMPGVLQIRNLGFFFVAGYLAAMPLALEGGGRWLRHGGIALGAIAFGLALWTGTRGSILAIWAAMATMVIVAPRFRSPGTWRYVWVTTLAGALLALLYQPPVSYMGLQRYLTSSPAESVTNPKEGRLAFWRATLGKIRERPCLGYGERQFSAVVFDGQKSYRQPHNMILQVMLQWGVIGALLFFGLLGAFCRAALRNVRYLPLDQFPAAAILIALLFYGLYDAALYYPYPIMMIALCGALLSGRNAVAEGGVHPVGEQQIG